MKNNFFSKENKFPKIIFIISSPGCGRLWALSVLLSGPFVIILKKIAQYYLMYRTKRKPKHLKFP